MQNLMCNTFRDQIRPRPHMGEVENRYFHARLLLQLIEPIDVGLYAADYEFSPTRERRAGREGEAWFHYVVVASGRERESIDCVTTTRFSAPSFLT